MPARLDVYPQPGESPRVAVSNYYRDEEEWFTSVKIYADGIQVAYAVNAEDRTTWAKLFATIAERLENGEECNEVVKATRKEER